MNKKNNLNAPKLIVLFALFALLSLTCASQTVMSESRPRIDDPQTYQMSGVAELTNGRRVANARVRATNLTRGFSYPEQRTRANGTYTFSGLLSGDYRIDMFVPGYSTLSKLLNIGGRFGATTTSINTESNSKINLDFRIDETNRVELRGIITDADRKTIPNALIKITSLKNGTSREITTGAGGSYEIGELDSGQYRVEAGAPDFQSRARKLTIMRGKSKTQNFSLRKKNN
ncbi:MAG TPA: carboxypeptidase-like regulatory domain-containing protein [Pyrinomonadaceae bacterium]|jgi:hypothetical protein